MRSAWLAFSLGCYPQRIARNGSDEQSSCLHELTPNPSLLCKEGCLLNIIFRLTTTLRLRRMRGFFFGLLPPEDREDPPAGGDEQSDLLFTSPLTPSPRREGEIQYFRSDMLHREARQGFFFVKHLPVYREDLPVGGDEHSFLLQVALSIIAG